MGLKLGRAIPFPSKDKFEISAVTIYMPLRRWKTKFFNGHNLVIAALVVA